MAAITEESAGGAALISFQDDDLKEIELAIAHSASCYYLQMDANREHMAMGSQDYCVTLWDLQEFVCRRTLTIE